MSIYKAECNECHKKFPCLMSEQALRNIAESHMMETGHTVDIDEYYDRSDDNN